jgi:putative tryptophan/tyrosine transport system substrate-binding protein
MKRVLSAGLGLRIGSTAIVTLGLALLLVPLPTGGQPPPKIYRIGYLTTTYPAAGDRTSQNCPTKGSPYWQAMVEGLRERGYLQGQNLVIECRYTEGREERAPALAAELASLKVDLIVAFSTANVRAAKQATSTIPIVMIGVINPAGRGLVDSLARPGGNVTGLAEDAGVQIVGKYLQLLKEAVPKVTRVAFLAYQMEPIEIVFRSEAEAAARALDVTPQFHYVREPGKLEGAFAEMAKARAEALVVMPHPFMSTNARRIVELAAQNRLPAIYPDRDHAEAGGLLAYDVNRLDIRRRVGLYADKIFKGTNPGDLPVEQPADFDFIVNLKTAHALGLTIPPSLLLRADEVIK